jgi:hypothetical protein
VVDLVSALTERKASATIDFAVKKADDLLLWLGLAAILIVLADPVIVLVWYRIRRRSAGATRPPKAGVPVG